MCIKQIKTGEVKYIMKTILLDCDGVILDYETEFIKHYTDKLKLNNKNKNIPNISLKSFEAFFNLPSEEITNMLKHFNNSEMFENLEPVKDAGKILKKLHHLGFKLYVITSCGNSKDIIQKREKNLLNKIGNIFADIVYLPLRSSKYEALFKWKNSGYYWIDDHVKNCKIGDKLGLNSFMFRTDFNKNILYPSIEHWQHFYNIIQNEHQYKEKIRSFAFGM